MSIEKPISTIRKAVQRLAEEGAGKEGLGKPEKRHYDDVFNSYKLLRMMEPKKFELYIQTSAKYQELKNEIGEELFKVFDKAWIHATKQGRVEIEKEERKLKRILNLSREEFDQRLKKIDEKFLKEKASLVRNDPQVVNAFSGKEEFLNKATDLVTLSMLDLMTYDRQVSNNM